MTLIDVANSLGERGIVTTPVIDKRPIIRDWQMLNEDETLAKTHAWDKANGLGIVCGERSGVICLDIDILEDDKRLYSIRSELLQMLPPIFCGLVGNPKKPPARFFRFSNESSRKFINIDCEILSTGNQKVIPPSFNPISKTNYEWVGHSIEDVDVDDLPYLPLAVLDFLEEADGKMNKKRGGKFAKAELTKEKGRSNHGSHNHLSKLAVRLFFQGYNFEDIVDLLMGEDEKINADSDSFYFLCPSRPEFGPVARTNAVRFAAEVVYRNANKRHAESDFFKDELASGFTMTTDGGRAVRMHLSLYNFLKIRHDPWYCPEMKSFMIWNGKHYKQVGDDFIRRFAQKHFKNPACINIGDKNTFLDWAKNEQQTEAYDFLLKDNGMVNFNNCVFDLASGGLFAHDKSYKFPYVIDCDFTGDVVETPIWDQFINLVTCNRQHMALAIEEFIGYAISGCSYNKFNKMLILDGEGSNGKSTLIRIIQGLVGIKNTSSTSLTSITQERFSGHSLVNKLINFCSEEPKESFSSTGVIKKLTGGDSIMVEEKHKGAFQYENNAKFVISYNKMPFFPDDSSGMKRRILLIPCQQDFDVNPELKMDKPDYYIVKDERAGVIAKCLRAYRAVVDRGHFTEVVEGVDRLNQMIVESNPVLSFIAEELSIDPNGSIGLDEIYDLFLASQGGYSKITKRNFLKRICDELVTESVTKKVVRQGIETKKCLVGVRRVSF